MATNFKHDQPTRADSVKARKLQKARVWRAVCKAVDARDGNGCRVCSRLAVHRHHIVYRSLGGKDTTANVIKICFVCHKLEHEHMLKITGDGDGVITVWDAR